MFRSIVTLILVVNVWIICQAENDAPTEFTCSAWGDPHVTRFPKRFGEEPEEVWCQQEGRVRLLSNEVIDAFIEVSEKPYVIRKFTMELFDTDRVSICTLTAEDLGSAKGCGDDVKISRNGDSMTIEYKTDNFNIKIVVVKNPYKGADAYNIYITQDSYLIKQSRGICKTSCDEKTGKEVVRHTRAASDQNLIKDSAEKICEIAISKLDPKFKVARLNQMDIMTKNAFTSCKTDLEVTGDTQFAKNSVGTLAMNLAAKDPRYKNNFQQLMKETFALIKKTNALIDAALVDYTKPSEPENKDAYSVEGNDDETISLSCRKTWGGEIRIVSAKYESLDRTCKEDATAIVQKICVKSKRFCQIAVSEKTLKHKLCRGEPKKLKVLYRCEEEN